VLLEAAARRIAESVRRVRAAAPRPAIADHPDLAQRVTIRLEDDPRAAARARHFLRGLLLAWEIGGDVPGTAELCLSELVTNAVIHAGTDSVLTVSLVDGSLTVRVRDRGPGSAADVELVDDEDPMRVFGRGLQLVDALADRWGSEQDAHGTTSWFVLDVGSAA
jgi:anti-sigma regulatory factor (Ser/Thr protein kinase)